MPAPKKPQGCLLGKPHRSSDARTPCQTRSHCGPIEFPIHLEVARPNRNGPRKSPSREGRQTQPKKMVQLSVRSAGTRIARCRRRVFGSPLEMKPTWMKVQLHILLGLEDSPGNSGHRFIPEICRLEGFDEERGFNM